MADPGLLGQAADLTPDALLLVGLDGTVHDGNAAAHRLIAGIKAGASLFELVSDPPETVRQVLARWAGSGAPVPGSLTFHGPAGPVLCHCRGERAAGVHEAGDSPVPGPVIAVHARAHSVADQPALLRDRLITLTREISYRRKVAAAREHLLISEQGVRDRLQRLSRLSTALASASTLAEVADVIRTEAASSLGGTTAVLALFPDQVLPSFIEPRAAGPASAGWYDLSSEPGSVLAHAARSPGPTMITASSRPLTAWSAAAARQDHSAYCLPLRLQGRRLGVLAVALAGTPAAALPDREQVASVAAQVAQAVARARLFEHEHHLAERLQRSLLPTVGQFPRLSVAARYVPNTEAVRVGGDWYDLFDIGPGQAGLAIGDVAGHSLAEATVMAQLRNALRAIALEHRRPGETLTRLNTFTERFLPETMATACYLTLDTRTGWLHYASAGHLPPVLITAEGGPRLLWGAHGPPLGAAPGTRFAGTRFPMVPGDTLLLYTDGVVERRQESLDTSLDRLLATARRAGGLDPDALCELLTASRPGEEWQDDRAVLAVRFEPGQAALREAG